MFKIMVLIKRKTGMSMEDFIDYYESNHAPLAARHLPMTETYTRHYLSPVGATHTGEVTELPYDVITEMTFADEATFGEAMAVLGKPEVTAEIVADEEKLFARETITFMKSDDKSTDMAAYR